MLRFFKIFIFFITPLCCSAENICGYWQLDFANTNKAQIAILIYEYEGLYYGKAVAIYDEKTGEIIDTPALKITKAVGVEGSPPLCGLDIIWALQKQGDKYTQGTVVNPNTGNAYNCIIFFDKAKGKLVLRGELLFFGQDEYLEPVLQSSLKPACIIKSPKPNIPHISFWAI